MKRSIFLAAILLILQPTAHAQKEVLFNAMKDELARSVGQLKLGDQAGPYFVSYLIRDAYSLRITADSGAITVNSESRSRNLRVDLRVGSYVQDNSNFVSLAGLTSSLASNASIPIDDDYDVVRRQIWQATDRAYKSALENLTRKKAALQQTTQEETLPDFTKSEAISSIGTANTFAIRKGDWSLLVDRLATLFVGQREIQKSKIELVVQVANSYYVNSEGATVLEPSSATRLTIVATTQADDGMPLDNFRIYTAARPEGLPERAKLDSDIKALISEMLAARTAPLAEEYSGPVLFLEQAAGELFAQGFGNLLTGRKAPQSDSPRTNSMIGRFFENPFLNKVNMKVAANFLSLKAVPSLTNYNQKALLGAYKIDEEGVPSRDVSLIENGMLKNLLSSRAPVKGILKSNGHGRGGAAIPSVIQVISANKKTYPQLKQELLNAAKEEGLPFGYMVRGLTPPSESQSGDTDILESVLLPQQGPLEPTQFRPTKPYQVFRVYPDGKEELVRGIEFGSISINAFKNVLAASDDEIVYDYTVNASNLLSGLGGLISLLGASGLMGSEYYTTVITPSLLVGGIDLKKSTGRYPKLPIVSYPTISNR